MQSLNTFVHLYSAHILSQFAHYHAHTHTHTAGVDYVSVNNAILRFDPATSRQCFDIGIRQDNIVEPETETFNATLTDIPSEGIILRPDQATIAIIDDTRMYTHTTEKI